jgi:hypothetical protein
MIFASSKSTTPRFIIESVLVVLESKIGRRTRTTNANCLGAKSVAKGTSIYFFRRVYRIHGLLKCRHMLKDKSVSDM